MCREDRTQLHPLHHLHNLCTVQPRSLHKINGAFQPAALSLSTRSQLIKTMSLLSNIGQMKIRREGSCESAQSRHIKIIQK